MSETRVAWLFPGQGSQYVGMGWELLRQFPAAAEIVARASEIAGKDLETLCLRGPDQALTRTDNLQPAITAINLGCARLLEEAGHRPDCVAGHSLGEFSALHVAGVLSLEDVLTLVTERGRLMHEASQTTVGGMVAVKGLAVAQIEEIAAQLQERYMLAIANYNAPQQTVLSGDRDAISEIQALVSAREGKAVALNVSGAWHSPLMRQAAERFAAALERVAFHPPRLPVFLNVTGAASEDVATIKSALQQQILSPVRWSASIDGMLEIGIRTFVEVGPGKVLRGLLQSIAPAGPACRVVGVESPQSLRFLDGARRG
ncbi:MAG TPA: ACP S-malonyltransferase [Candidatus Competibacter sp.]|nr:ACP S-malonyltransferase [Candidatus Competibacter sp.]HUM95575.1 ACP S-malonyltransferase [Candidatus Competibacter sp.]